MAYDPYGSQESQPVGQSPFSWVGSYYTFKYFQNPFTWDMSRGIATPFGISPTEKGLSTFGKTVAGTYRKEGFWKTLRSVPKELRKAATAGKGKILGTSSIQQRIARLQKELDRSIASSAKLREFVKATSNFDAIPRELAGFPDPIAKVIKRRNVAPGKVAGLKTGKTWEYVGRYPKPSKSVAFDITNRLELWDEREILIKKLGFNQRRQALFRKGIKGLKRAKFWSKAAIGTGKAVSVIGALWLAADVGMMVAEPLGRMLVEQTNAVIDRAQQRFMPELGGKLNAAYLSYGAATERQRALDAISKSHINGRSAYGQEAAFMHS